MISQLSVCDTSCCTDSPHKNGLFRLQLIAMEVQTSYLRLFSGENTKFSCIVASKWNNTGV